MYLIVFEASRAIAVSCQDYIKGELGSQRKAPLKLGLGLVKVSPIFRDLCPMIVGLVNQPLELLALDFAMVNDLGKPVRKIPPVESKIKLLLRNQLLGDAGIVFLASV